MTEGIETTPDPARAEAEPDGCFHSIDKYEWGTVVADARDPKAGGASHVYKVRAGSNTLAVVRFQHGPRNVKGSTVGALDDHMLAIVQDRLAAFQAGPFAHPSNELALEHVKEARRMLRERAEERRARGVLGKNEK